MPIIVATFGRPEDITPDGDDGKVFRYPVEVIDRNEIGTPRQSSKTKVLRVTVKISNTLRASWPPNESDLIKTLFEVAREHLTNELRAGTWKGNDLEVITKERPCPYDPKFIQEPTGAVVEIRVQHRIGFI
jgi:hypothetical protein